MFADNFAATFINHISMLNHNIDVIFLEMIPLNMVFLGEYHLKATFSTKESMLRWLYFRQSAVLEG